MDHSRLKEDGLHGNGKVKHLEEARKAGPDLSLIRLSWVMVACIPKNGQRKGVRLSSNLISPPPLGCLVGMSTMETHNTASARMLKPCSRVPFLGANGQLVQCKGTKMREYRSS